MFESVSSLSHYRTKRSFGDDRFHYFMFLVFCQCIVNALVAASGNLNDTVVWDYYFGV